jgi:hypothetical protein
MTPRPGTFGHGSTRPATTTPACASWRRRGRSVSDHARSHNRRSGRSERPIRCDCGPRRVGHRCAFERKAQVQMFGTVAIDAQLRETRGKLGTAVWA